METPCPIKYPPSALRMAVAKTIAAVDGGGGWFGRDDIVALVGMRGGAQRNPVVGTCMDKDSSTCLLSTISTSGSSRY